MVLCSFFPRADSGPGGLNAVLRIKVILLNPFPPVLRHFSKSRGASARPFPQFESTYACARFFYMSFSGLLLYHALRSSAVAVCEPGVFEPSGGQFQVNVLPSGNGGSISRGSVWREGKHRPRRQAVVRRDRADVRTGPEKAGSGGAVEGEFRRREAERCAQVRNFCRKAPRFSSFYGDFCDKVRTFFLSVALFRAINRGEAPINGDENEAESARMYIRGVKNW